MTNKIVDKIDKRHKCHDCGVLEGQIHKDGCDMEKCPFCGGQHISCSCRYKKLGYSYDESKEYCGLPYKIYSEGLSEKEEIRYFKMIEKIRVSYIVFPWVCARCGVLWPDMFMVPNEEWEKYIPIDERDVILCKKCYKMIKNLVDNSVSDTVK